MADLTEAEIVGILLSLDEGGRKRKMETTRGGVKFWETEALVAKTRYISLSPRLPINYINHKDFGYANQYFYYTLEFLALRGVIEINKRFEESASKQPREMALNQPTEFRILDNNACSEYFDCLFMKRGETLIDTPESKKSNVINRKTEADHRWKTLLFWFIIKEEDIVNIDRIIGPDKKKILSNDESLAVASSLSIPYPNCFSDDMAMQRVFKYVHIDHKVKIQNTLSIKHYEEKLREINSRYNPLEDNQLRKRRQGPKSGLFIGTHSGLP